MTAVGPGDARPNATPVESSEAAFRAALVALLPILRAQARGLTGRPDAADDLVQETVTLALRAATRPPHDALRPWVFVIQRNAWRSEIRRRRRRDDGEAMAEVLAGRSVAGNEAGGAIGLPEALAALPPDQREALLLLTTQGVSGAEAARICGVPEGTLRARASRARAALRRRLGTAPRVRGMDDVHAASKHAAVDLVASRCRGRG